MKMKSEEENVAIDATFTTENITTRVSKGPSKIALEDVELNLGNGFVLSHASPGYNIHIVARLQSSLLARTVRSARNTQVFRIEGDFQAQRLEVENIQRGACDAQEIFSKFCVGRDKGVACQHGHAGGGLRGKDRGDGEFVLAFIQVNPLSGNLFVVNQRHSASEPEGSPSRSGDRKHGESPMHVSVKLDA